MTIYERRHREWALHATHSAKKKKKGGFLSAALDTQQEVLCPLQQGTLHQPQVWTNFFPLHMCQLLYASFFPGTPETNATLEIKYTPIDIFFKKEYSKN